jgi:hypothetical protein
VLNIIIHHGFMRVQDVSLVRLGIKPFAEVNARFSIIASSPPNPRREAGLSSTPGR